MLGIRTGRKLILAVLTVAIVVCLAPAVASGADWPMYRGPNHNGITAEGIDRWPPVKLWEANVGWGFAQVTVSNGRVYTAGWASGSREERPTPTR